MTKYKAQEQQQKINTNKNIEMSKNVLFIMYISQFTIT